MNKSTVIYATFAPEDTAKARVLLDELQHQRPDITILGRHQFGFSAGDKRAAEQIQRAAITLVLIGRNTFADAMVRQDLEESRAKRPPNQILAIYLEVEVPMQENLIGETLEITGAGGEILPVGGDFGSGLERAVQRVRRVEQIQSEVIAPRSSSRCNR